MEVKDKILKTASEMFLSLGVRNVTMDNLAGELGISKRTLYELFKDKDDLVVQCLRHMLIEDNKEFLTIIENSDNVIQAILLIMKRQEEKRREFPKVFMEDIKKYFHAVNASFFSCKETLNKFSASYTLINKGVKQGIFRKGLRTELVDTFIHEIITVIHNSERIHLLQPSDKEILNSIVLPYFRGLATTKGVELLNTYFNEQSEQ